MIDFVLSCDSKSKKSLAHTSKKICFHEACNKTLIEYLSVAGKQINEYETIDKAVSDSSSDNCHPPFSSGNYVCLSLYICLFMFYVSTLNWNVVSLSCVPK